MSQELDAFKAQLAGLFMKADENPEVSRLLMLSVGRVWYNAVKANPELLPTVNLLSTEDRDIQALQSNQRVSGYLSNIPHIADWLRAAVVNGDAWLKRVDEKNRPKKLMKFGSLDQIMAEADKAMLKAAQKGRDIQLDESQEKLIRPLSDGYSLVELLSPEALDRESAYMQHCIGNGGYDYKVGNEDFRYISLRDSSNKPHATMELERDEKGEWEIVQFQGKQNQSPVQKYCDVLVPYFKEENLSLSGSVKKRLPYMIDTDGNWHGRETLPRTMICDEFTTSSDEYVDVRKKEIESIINMPEHLTVLHRFGISFKKLTNFPSIIEMKSEAAGGKDAGLWGCDFRKFPKDVKISGNLKIIHGMLNAAPESITATGDIDISLISATEFPKSLKAEGSINLSRVPLKELDCSISAGHGLSIRDSDILSIPDDLNIHKLALTELPMEKLPENLTVVELSLKKTKITSLPDSIQVQKAITLDNFDFEYFPDSIDDEVALNWVDTEAFVEKSVEGPATVGEWRAMKRNLAM